MNAVQTFSGNWACDDCGAIYATQLEADKCCTPPAVGDDQEAFTLEEIDEGS